MNSGEIDKFPVSQLMGRYDLVRSAVYKRMEQLGIKPEKVGNRAYVSAEQVRLLDELHLFIQNGGSAAEFVEAKGLNRPSADTGNGNSAGTGLAQPADFGRFINAIMDLVSRSQPPPDPMKPYSDLESAAQNNWVLSTADVAYLLDLPPSEIRRCGDYFQDAGFVFTRVGYRRDGQEAWQVTKPKRRLL